MFDKITISRKGRSLEEPVDLGFLAECLVFYRRVTVIAEFRDLQVSRAHVRAGCPSGTDGNGRARDPLL